MDGSRVSVYVNFFSASATKNDVVDFLHPIKPIEVRLASRNNDPRGCQSAFVDFKDVPAALAAVSQKNGCRFMGRTMKLGLTFNPPNEETVKFNRTQQESRSLAQPRTNIYQPRQILRQINPKGRCQLRNSRTPQCEIIRGTFKIFASVSSTHFVALETGWQSDMDNLSRGLQDYGDFAKCFLTDDIEPEEVCACKEPVSGKWRRCRKIAVEAGSYVVELIDEGGTTVVGRDQILRLSQLYRDWSIKSVDLFFHGYVLASGSTEVFKQIEEHLLNKTFQLAYLHERTGPLVRDRVCVMEMRENGKLVLDQLVEKGLLVKKQPPSPTNGSLRPIVKTPQVSRTSSSSPPLSTAFTKSQKRIQNLDQDGSVFVNSINSNPETNGGNWSQKQLVSPTEKRQNEQMKDGWGSVGSTRDDVGTEVWNKVNTPSGNRPGTPDLDRAPPAWNIGDWSESSSEAKSSKLTPQKVKAAATHSPVVSAVSGPPTAVIQQTVQISKPKVCKDVFSEADEWKKEERPKCDFVVPALEKLSITEENTTQCNKCNELGTKLQSLEKLLNGPSIQMMVSNRLSWLCAELNQLKVRINTLLIVPSNSESEVEELRHLRRAAQVFTEQLSDTIPLASPETLTVFGMRPWAQFVGKIWAPMMNLLYFNEKPLSVYRNTVIRKVELDTNDSLEKSLPVTVVLERAIDTPKIFESTQHLMTHKGAAKVHRIFFSEDTSKVFVILEKPEADEDLDEYGRRAVDFLLGLGIFQ